MPADGSVDGFLTKAFPADVCAVARVLGPSVAVNVLVACLENRRLRNSRLSASGAESVV